jgi:hypothetical protein
VLQNDVLAHHIALRRIASTPRGISNFCSLFHISAADQAGELKSI